MTSPGKNLGSPLSYAHGLVPIQWQLCSSIFRLCVTHDVEASIDSLVAFFYGNRFFLRKVGNLDVSCEMK
jgi:hypothetical protein